jgi:hypothetical protein
MIGPVAMILWALILAIRGKASIWQGDVIGFGFARVLILALFVGFLTSTSYVIALRVVHRWTAPA